MHFDILAFLYTIGCCLTSLIIAGKSGNKENKEWFAKLNHPDKSFLFKIMNIVGIIFYLLFGIVLYHLFIFNNIVSIIIVIIIILMMGLSPLFLYKTKNLKLFFFTMLLFPILISVLIFSLIKINYVLAIMVIVYLLWLVYDLSLFYRLMKLNK
jgi:tryptophan-rich sensory protein